MKHINFPKDFIWGTASSSYQTEGAYNRDGKGASIWDTFCQKSGVIADSSDGTLACCYYDNYEEDIRFMADAGIRAYRFSVSWPRIFPNGDDPAVNPLGLAFYDRVVDCCIRYGIQPHITLFTGTFHSPFRTAAAGCLRIRLKHLCVMLLLSVNIFRTV